jgi:hypothetical protein
MKVTSGRLALVLSGLALVVALSGTAYAVNTIRSSDIVNGTIKSEDIGGGQVRTTDIRNGTVATVDLAAASMGHARRLWAKVSETGVLVRSAGVSGAARDGTGIYTVTFVRNVSNCAVSATPFDEVALAAYDNAAPNAINVLTYNPAGVSDDSAFDLVLVC